MCFEIDRPIFFIGMPRSGTTVIFEYFSEHPWLGWLSNYSLRFPRTPAWNVLLRLTETQFWRLRGKNRQYEPIHLLNRYSPKPQEGYPFWKEYCGEKFLWDFHLKGSMENPKKARLRKVIALTLQYQGRRRFVTKLTGQPRVRYLNEVFHGAIFIHLIRDGRAVVQSLLKVDFWREKGGLTGPFWRGALTEEDIRVWEASGRSPAVLASLQWCRVIEATREESKCLAPEQFVEVRYEDFVADPDRVLMRLYDFCGLPQRPAMNALECPKLDNMNSKYSGMPPRDQVLIEDVMRDHLNMLGYELSVP